MSAIDFENYEPALKQGAGMTVQGPLTIGGLTTFNGGTQNNGSSVRRYTTQSAVNISATLTAAQVAGGYITSTSAAGVTMTMPTGTLLGTQVAAVKGTVLVFYVDNTAGASTITMAVGVNAVQSDWDNQITTATASVTPAAITPLTIASGVSGIAEYTVVFSSATAYTFSRTA